MQYRTVGTEPRPFWDAIKEFPTACGQVGWDAVRSDQRACSRCFAPSGWPVLYPLCAPKESFDNGRLSDKVPAIMTVAAKGYEFVAEVAPRETDICFCRRSIRAPSSARRSRAT